MVPQDRPRVHCMASMYLSGLVISYIPMAEFGFAPQKETVIASPDRTFAGYAFILTPEDAPTSTGPLAARLSALSSPKIRNSYIPADEGITKARVPLFVPSRYLREMGLSSSD